MTTEQITGYDEALRRIALAGERRDTELSLAGLDLERLPEEFNDLIALQSLDLTRCDRLQNLQPLAKLATLRNLHLNGCWQLQDLQPLAGLTALQNLSLSWCRQLQDLQPLAGLTELQSLALNGCMQIQDLQPLSGLTGLQRLQLSQHGQLRDLQPLAGLTALQSLHLSGCGQLQNLQPLVGLTTLQNLNLSWCPRLQDLQPLTSLTALQSLDLSGCRQLQDLQPLAGLTALQSLDVSECGQLQDLGPLSGLMALQRLNLSGCEQFQTLRPLAGLTALQSLDLSGCQQFPDLQPLGSLTALRRLSLKGYEQFQDLQPLAGLTVLQHLDLSECEQLKNLQPLAGLTALQSLDLSGCQQLQNLQPLADLTALQSLELRGCQQFQDLQPLAGLAALNRIDLYNGPLLDCSPGAQPLTSWENHQELELFADRLVAAPAELGSTDSHSDNALPRIRAWQQDLQAGEAPNSTVKLFILGNGHVGKTQICRRLGGEGFDEAIPSTHGISLGEVQLAKADAYTPAVDAAFWDFGGQDVYLGTHALFLDERAIYVIAWTPAHENADEYEQSGVPMRNRPLVYWLEYVRSLAGSAAPVIVVQTQCDRELDVRPAPVPADHGFDRLCVTSSSARQEDGMEALQLELKRAARYQLERYGKVRLPASWVAVRDELRRRIAERTLPRAGFDELCAACHASALPGVVLEFLHRSGQVFWREGLFGDQVVLDQSWALAGVYAVLERNTALPEIRRRGGTFSPQLLAALVWRDYSDAEQKLFLSLMEQCRICFQVTEDLYVAPALLPALESMEGAMQQVWRDAVPDAVVRLDHAFLHEGILRAVLCGIGEKAGVHAVYWAYGVCFYDIVHRSTVRITSILPDVAAGETKGSVVVEACRAGGDRAGDASGRVHRAVEHRQAAGGDLGTRRRWHQEETKKPSPPRQAEAAFAQVRPAQPPIAAGEPRPVYVSYAIGRRKRGPSGRTGAPPTSERLPARARSARDAARRLDIPVHGRYRPCRARAGGAERQVPALALLHARTAGPVQQQPGRQGDTDAAHRADRRRRPRMQPGARAGALHNALERRAHGA